LLVVHSSGLLPGPPLPFEQDGRWGYKDAVGRWAIPPRFEIAGSFSPEGLAAVVDTRGWAYINLG
jgi:hypothetical protein